MEMNVEDLWKKLISSSLKVNNPQSAVQLTNLHYFMKDQLKIKITDLMPLLETALKIKDVEKSSIFPRIIHLMSLTFA